MPTLKRVSKLLKYGLGSGAKRRKQAAKAEARRERFLDGERWQHGQEFATRRYAGYEEYVAHQASKLDKIAERLRKTEAEDLAEFRRRFEGCAALAAARSVLCLGARLGTEVRALHALGHFAVGIDLNPGPDNAYVLPGDFHNLVFPDGSADAVYTNALDHAFDLERIVGEVRRVLRPGGLFVVDLIAGFGEDAVPGDFEAIFWRDSNAMVDAVRRLSGFELIEARDLGRLRRDRWRQAVLRKPAA